MNKFSILLALLSLTFPLFSQTDIPLVDDLGEETVVVEKVFPAIKVFNLHSTNVLPRGEMKLYLGHRMGEISAGVDGLFGLFTANSRIGGDLGLSKRATIGIGSTSQQKIYDGYIKYIINHQGSHSIPVSIAVLTNVSAKLAKSPYPTEAVEFWQKLSYYSSLMVSRKFSENLSAQAMVAVIHKNMVISSTDKNTIVATGLSANYKLSRMWHLAGEYAYAPSNMVGSTNATSHIVSLGIQLQTGPRHVFQLFLSNSGGLNETEIITNTKQKFKPNHLRLSFNIPTTFKAFK